MILPRPQLEKLAEATLRAYLRDCGATLSAEEKEALWLAIGVAKRLLAEPARCDKTTDLFGG